MPEGRLEVDAAGLLAARPEASTAFWPAAWRRFRRNRLALASGVLLLALAFAAAGAGVFATHDPYEQFLQTGGATGKFQAPSADHLFGTDELARDIFSRTLFGLRISLGAALSAVVIVTAIGLSVGVVAASGPRWVDEALMRATDVGYAFPDILLVILLRSALGDSLFGLRSILGVDMDVLLLFAAIGLTGWPTMARLVRGQLLALRETEFTMAARAAGASPARLALRHWLPNATGPVIVEATFLVPRAIFAEATLSFIGVGVTPPVPSLGVLIASHFSFVAVQWTALAIPTALLAVLFICFQFFGDGVRDALDPRAGR